jgi:hypothetical protein
MQNLMRSVNIRPAQAYPLSAASVWSELAFEIAASVGIRSGALRIQHKNDHVHEWVCYPGLAYIAGKIDTIIVGR